MIRCLSSLALLALTACTATTELTRPRVRVAISVDWEGYDLSTINLRAFTAFHDAHPNVPLTHFLNAAYFTKPNADAEEVSALIRWVLRPTDELGLHIHPWKSLVESAGVAFRNEPTIWGPAIPLRSGPGDVGHEVSVEAYTVDEFRAIVRKSKELLAKNGFQLGTSFRAGAWLAGPRVREAIRREGFLVDSSATDTIWHDEVSDYELPAMIREVWPNVTCHSQPFPIATPAGPLLEMPDTGALADYVTADEMTRHVNDVVSRLHPDTDLYVHLGFHQETAALYLPRVIAAVRAIQAAHGDRVVFETLAASARSVGSQILRGPDSIMISTPREPQMTMRAAKRQ